MSWRLLARSKTHPDPVEALLQVSEQVEGTQFHGGPPRSVRATLREWRSSLALPAEVALLSALVAVEFHRYHP